MSSSVVSVVPFADLLVKGYISSNYKKYFLEQFGIHELMDLIDNNKDIAYGGKVIRNGDSKWIKLKEVIHEINMSKIMGIMDCIFNKNSKKSLENETESGLKTALISLGGLLLNVSDDILRAVTTATGAVLKTIFAVVAIASLPVMMAVYCYFCCKGVTKIIDELANYSNQILDILHVLPD